MRAVILAGGRGTRLHPLTNTIPKPLAPMFDRPVMAHAIELLAAHGIRDITVTLGYRAGQIMEWFGSGRRMGVNIDYYVEETPRGTAGGLKDMASRFQGTFVVLSGDALTDFDLSAAIRFHQRNHAWATLLSYEVNDPSQFGLVQTDAEKVISLILSVGLSASIKSATCEARTWKALFSMVRAPAVPAVWPK